MYWRTFEPGNPPIATHFTNFIDSDTMAAALNILIDEMDCNGSIPVEIHRYVALDGESRDYPLTALEYFNVNAFLYGVEEAVQMPYGATLR